MRFMLAVLMMGGWAAAFAQPVEPVKRVKATVSGDIVKIEEKERSVAPESKGNLLDAVAIAARKIAEAEIEAPEALETNMDSERDWGIFNFLLSDDEPEAVSGEDIEAAMDDSDMDVELTELYTPPSPNVVIGRVVHVDETRQFAVVWLDTRRIVPFGQPLTRSFDMALTAGLGAELHRSGRALAFNIEWGAPAVGEEVYIVGGSPDPNGIFADEDSPQ